MSNLPTAHASQSFGHRTIDFYAAPGQVTGSDPRSRSDERRIQDMDGARHAVRLSDRDFGLDAGDLAAVLRAQSGPSHKSRPVAVINYSSKTWTRTQPDARTLLSKTGVARNVNWALAMLTFLLAIAVLFWPELRAFAVEFFPVSASVLPQFDVFAQIAAAAPDLASWRIESSFGSLIEGAEQALPILAGYGAVLIFAALVAGGAVITYFARSWRLLWVPILIAVIAALSVGLSGVEQAAAPAAGALTGVAGIFLIGGLINRNRDVWRLEKRISRLADHLLRHPPEEMVTASYASGYRGAEQTDGAQPSEAGTEIDTEADVETSSHADAANDTGADVVAEEAVSSEDIAPDAPLAADGPYSQIDAGAAAAAAEAGHGGETDEDTPVAGNPADDTLAERASDEAEPLENAGEPASAIEDGAEGETGESGNEGEAPLTGEASRTEHEAEPATEDPRHASRDISLPPPPPMPKATEALKPDAPLTHAGLPPSDEKAPDQDDKS